MNKIKFSHSYEKMPIVWEGTQAVLIGVEYCPNVQDLFRVVPWFKEYDTAIRDSDEHYLIGFDEAIILFFFHFDTEKLFTTIRRYTAKKYEYYKLNVFKTFTLEPELP